MAWGVIPFDGIGVLVPAVPAAALAVVDDVAAAVAVAWETGLILKFFLLGTCKGRCEKTGYNCFYRTT